MCGYPLLSPGQELLWIGAGPTVTTYTLPGLWRRFGLASAKGVLEGVGPQENTQGRCPVLVMFEQVWYRRGSLATSENTF